MNRKRVLKRKQIEKNEEKIEENVHLRDEVLLFVTCICILLHVSIHFLFYRHIYVI